MDCFGNSLSNSGPLEFSDTDRPKENSTVEPKSKALNDDSNKENKVRKRTVYSPAQLQELHAYFNRHAYLDSEQMRHISRRLGLTYSQVRKWFQNMRMKKKKQWNASVQEFQSSKMYNPLVMNPSGTQGIDQPDVVQPAVVHSAVAQPAVVHSAVAQPAVVHSAVAQPAVVHSAVAQPTVIQPTLAQPAITLQQGSLTNTTTHAIKMDNQSWDNFFHLQQKKQQKKAEFPNGYHHQAPVVPTYSFPYLEPHTVQSNYGMDQSWNMPLRTNSQQQQNRGNDEAGLVYDHPEANSLARENIIFTQL